MKKIMIGIVLKSILRRKTKNTFIILGIAFGVSLLLGIQITIDSVDKSWETNSLYGLGDRHVQIVNTIQPYINETWYHSISNIILNSNPSIEGVTTRLVSTSTITNSNTGNIEISVPVVGIAPEEKEFGQLKEKNSGTILSIDSLQINEVFVGENLAINLQIQTGDSITISIFGNGNIFEKSFLVKSIFAQSGKGYEDFASQVIFKLDNLQQFVNQSDKVNIIYCKLDNSINSMKKSEMVTNDLKESFTNFNYLTENEYNQFRIVDVRQETITNIKDSMRDISMMLEIFGILIMLTGIFLIVNIQIFSLNERKTETGLMQVIGFNSTEIATQDLIESLLLGLVGGFLAFPLGIGYSYILLYVFAQNFDITFSLLSLNVSLNIILFSISLGILIGIITALIPAILASRTSIVKSIYGISSKKQHVKVKN